MAAFIVKGIEQEAVDSIRTFSEAPFFFKVYPLLVRFSFHSMGGAIRNVCFCRHLCFQ